jgi:hypothetical protein
MSMTLNFYAVRYKGEYFRRRGFGGSGKQWVDDLARATIYPNRAQAVSRVTWWARHGGIMAELIRLSVSVDGVEPMAEQFAKLEAKREKALHNANVAAKRRAFEQAKSAYDAVRK